MGTEAEAATQLHSSKTGTAIFISRFVATLSMFISRFSAVARR
jgi:hypothetical protein